MMDQQFQKAEEEEEDEDAPETEEETEINEFGIAEIKYPDPKENQVDIFYLSGYDKYMEYYEKEYLSSLSEELSTSSKKLTTYISSSLLQLYSKTNLFHSYLHDYMTHLQVLV